MTSLINILLIMTHTLPQLPYAEDALAPKMSKETIEYHHGKHQRTYVDNLNKLIAGTPYENMSLEEIIVRADGPIFNNAAQDWNHTFFFFTLSPTPKSMPSGPLAEAIDRDFGSFDAFKEQFTSAAAALFGSGWTWLVKDRDGKLSIRPMPNAGNPLRDGLTPLLTVRLSPAAHYAANLLLLAAFGWLAVHRERIDLRGLLRSIVRRQTAKPQHPKNGRA